MREMVVHLMNIFFFKKEMAGIGVSFELLDLLERCREMKE